ncbi:DUF1810 domain-containing protein [Pedobacter rhodius]|uniref:DUF1810 domain-containing protein n=1 Tax=Pedobacter rhodius TaxID=3004098 RepID=A0ABT4KUE0_9SPHI|nr:DUF1810 domain-containing protein [Pedobacter sp. SJ11]MCZ4222536.1 DUF1810 domain-containing protein [Pedobacter sp. SJ11]
MNNFQHFLDAQNQMFSTALAEIKNGAKTSHWMWYIFPQLAGLGQSEISKNYSLRNLDEASNYLAHPVLNKHLIEISKALLDIRDKSANEILGTPDDLKLHSSMTLFSLTNNPHPVFKAVLDKYFNGQMDQSTLNLLGLTNE